MRKENLRCPMCGTMNYDVDLDATDGWTKCRLCKAVTCSMDEWKKAYSVRSSVKRKTARGTQYDSQVMHAAF